MSQLLAWLCCPRCKGSLAARGQALHCSRCERTYPIVLGIPDLRVYDDPLVPLHEDYRKAESLQAEAGRLSFAELVRLYWALGTHPPTPPDLSQRFIDHVLSDEIRIAGYEDKLGRGGLCLDVGCGAGALAKVVRTRFESVVACDVAFRWLVVARKRLTEAQLPANVVCCCADYLPFPDGRFDCVAAVALLEHVGSAGAVVNECSRVLAKGGRTFFLTTNRFSLAPEPHVRVWGVGFLPRRWMPAYVKWRRRLAYERKHLLSCREVRRLLRKAGFDSIRLWLPAITAPDWDNLKGWERAAARVFERLSRVSWLRPALLFFCPVIQASARRAANVPRMQLE